MKRSDGGARAYGEGGWRGQTVVLGPIGGGGGRWRGQTVVLGPMGRGVERSDGGARAYGEEGGEVRRWC